MAFHCSFLLSLLPLLTLFRATSSIMTTHASHSLINAICKETRNPEFCRTSLNDFPRTKDANANELGANSIILAMTQARLNRYLVKDTMNNEKDSLTKNALSLCLRDYTIILNKLRRAYMSSDEKDYKRMLSLLKDAMKMTNKCDEGFTGGHGRHCPIKDYNQKMAWLIDIAVVILRVVDV